MALIVEDGTGKSDAESYESVANGDIYWANRSSDPLFLSWDGAGEPGKEEALRVSTQEVDAENEPFWKGEKGSSLQALDWPRFNAFDSSGYSFDNFSVPVELTSYILERAARYIANIALGVIPDIDAPSGSIIREKIKAGPVELDTSYAGGASPAKTFPKLETLITSLIDGGGGLVVRS